MFPERSQVAVNDLPLTAPTVSSEMNPPPETGSTMSIGMLLKPPTPLTFPPVSCASSPVRLEVPKSASSVRKHLVPALLQSSGRSTIHSAEALAQLEHVAVMVLLLPVDRSDIASVNSPLAKLTEESMMSPAWTANTLTEFAGNISYHASYLGVVLPEPPQWAKVPSCSTESVL